MRRARQRTRLRRFPPGTTPSASASPNANSIRLPPAERAVRDRSDPASVPTSSSRMEPKSKRGASVFLGTKACGDTSTRPAAEFAEAGTSVSRRAASASALRCPCREPCRPSRRLRRTCGENEICQASGCVCAAAGRGSLFQRLRRHVRGGVRQWKTSRDEDLGLRLLRARGLGNPRPAAASAWT